MIRIFTFTAKLIFNQLLISISLILKVFIAENKLRIKTSKVNSGQLQHHSPKPQLSKNEKKCLKTFKKTSKKRKTCKNIKLFVFEGRTVDVKLYFHAKS